MYDLKFWEQLLLGEKYRDIFILVFDDMWDGFDFSIRVVKNNGVYMGITDDFDVNRINIEINEGIIIDIVDIG